MTIDSFAKKRNGCNGTCKHKVERIEKIKFLKNNHNIGIYFLKFAHKHINENFYKVGITKQNIKYRFKGTSYCNYTIEECQIVESTNLLTALQEDEFIKKYYDKYGYIPSEKFDGYTECFKSEIIGEFS